MAEEALNKSAMTLPHWIREEKSCQLARGGSDEPD